MGRTQFATAEQLKALLSSYAEDDRSRFLSVASQIAAKVARDGAQELAEQLLELVAAAKRGASRNSIPIARPVGELAGLVSAQYPSTRLSEMVLDESVERSLARVIREYRNAEQLEARGLEPRRKLLLVGPPGCGKSMTAAALAGELGRPLLQVQLHALIAKFMGETAAKLHLIFDAMSRSPGVYLFDEFDALGAQRGADNDVGEARRILNSFLVFLEQERSRSLIIAATNLPTMLDEALFRRFDDVIHYRAPSGKMSEALIRNRLAQFDTRTLSWPKLHELAAKLSHADIVKACEDAAKEAVLDGKRRVTTDALAKALRARSRTR